MKTWKEIEKKMKSKGMSPKQIAGFKKIYKKNQAKRKHHA